MSLCECNLLPTLYRDICVPRSRAAGKEVLFCCPELGVGVPGIGTLAK